MDLDAFPRSTHGNGRVPPRTRRRATRHRVRRSPRRPSLSGRADLTGSLVTHSATPRGRRDGLPLAQRMLGQARPVLGRGVRGAAAGRAGQGPRKPGGGAHDAVEDRRRRQPGAACSYDLVDATTGQIRLRCTLAEFQTLRPADPGIAPPISLSAHPARMMRWRTPGPSMCRHAAPRRCARCRGRLI
jgi:hypothetical protein